MKSILVDVDGTLADCSHRRHFVEKKPRDWKSFFDPARIMADEVIEPVAFAVRCLYATNKIVIVSGRKEEHKQLTEDWLKANHIPYDEIHLRADNDFREDWIVKSEILDRLMAADHKVALVIDDRQQVVDMWRARGLVCMQVAPGNF